MKKLITAEEAANLINDCTTVAINGFALGFGFPEEICQSIEKRFLTQQHPRDLTLVFGSGCGDSGKSNFGLEHFAHETMVKRVIGGHIGLSAKLSNMICENKIEAYNFPQGVVTHLFREIAGGRPGVLTHVGMETFVDPRVESAKMNDTTTEDLVSVVNINNSEKLFYKSFPIDAALIRGTTADENGNITIEKEGVALETLHIAEAAKNSGGIVIAQVERIAKEGTLNPLHVAIPGIMVDHVVVADADNHKMNSGNIYDPSFTGEIKVPVDLIPPMPLNVRKVIAKRCAAELKLDTVINLGIGVPEGVAAIALEEKISDRLTMTIEAGAIGGIPGSGCDLGASRNLDAMIGQPNIFDFYDGGGLDIAFLGLAQADRQGNINVSKFNGRTVGCGGFINISQNTKKVVFCGTFTAGKSDIFVENNELHIVQDGQYHKFVQNVEQITFSGSYANKTRQEILYVTERAVFKLTEKGIELIEIAPGIDLQKHILDKMDFKPIISDKIKTMDWQIFSNSLLGINSTKN